MQTENQIYHEEDQENLESLRLKQEVTKKLLYSILIQPETIDSWKIRHGIEIKQELVTILHIDLEENFEIETELEDDPESEDGFEIEEGTELGEGVEIEGEFDLDDDFDFNSIAIIRKRVLFVAKLNENAPYQIDYTCEIMDGHMSIEIDPTEYIIDYGTHDDDSVIFSGDVSGV